MAIGDELKLKHRIKVWEIIDILNSLKPKTKKWVFKLREVIIVINKFRNSDLE